MKGCVMKHYDPEQFITRRELAATGIVSYDKLASDAMKGIGIPYHKLGRKVLYKWADVQSYLESTRVDTSNNTQKAVKGDINHG